MKLRKFVISAVFSSVLLGGIASAAYVHSTIEQYRNAAPCGQLKGVPGLLQKAHFLSAGNCTVNLDGSCNFGAACTISNPASGTPTRGICFPSKSPACVCLAFN